MLDICEIPLRPLLFSLYKAFIIAARILHIGGVFAYTSRSTAVLVSGYGGYRFILKPLVIMPRKQNEACQKVD